MSIVVPSLNGIANQYDASLATVQFVISAYLFGLAAAQPFMGYFCDRFGRRPVMLAGFSIFVVASIVCALAPSLDYLIAARFLQAVGTSAGTVASRAILRDTCRGDELASAMSYIAAAMGIAPVVAPIVGGLLDTHASIGWLFLVTAAIGLLVFVAMYVLLPETLAENAKRPDAGQLVRNYGVLFRSRAFLGNTFLYGFVQGAFFCFLAVGAAYFLDSYGMNATSFGAIWGVMAVAYVLGATAGARLTMRIGSENLLRASVLMSVLTAVALLVMSMNEPIPALAILAPVFVLMMLSGTTTPGAMAGAIRPHPEMAGTASGLSSATGLVLSGSFTVIAGVVYAGSFLPVAGLIVTACLLAAFGWWLARA